MSSSPSSSRLTDPQRDKLWQVAQMIHGWAHVRRFGGELQVADALVRRGLVEWGRNGRDHHDPRIVATPSGRAEIERRWPISPYVLGTYETQPNGWDPKEGRRRKLWRVDLNDVHVHDEAGHDYPVTLTRGVLNGPLMVGVVSQDVPLSVAESLADELEAIVPTWAVSAQRVLAEFRAAYPRERAT